MCSHIPTYEPTKIKTDTTSQDVASVKWLVVRATLDLFANWGELYATLKNKDQRRLGSAGGGGKHRESVRQVQSHLLRGSKAEGLDSRSFHRPLCGLQQLGLLQGLWAGQEVFHCHGWFPQQ